MLMQKGLIIEFMALGQFNLISNVLNIQFLYFLPYMVFGLFYCILKTSSPSLTLHSTVARSALERGAATIISSCWIYIYILLPLNLTVVVYLYSALSPAHRFCSHHTKIIWVWPPSSPIPTQVETNPDKVLFLCMFELNKNLNNELWREEVPYVTIS